MLHWPSHSDWAAWRSCGRKKRLTQLEANRLMLEAWAAGDWSLISYRCGICGQHHVGHDRREETP